MAAMTNSAADAASLSVVSLAVVLESMHQISLNSTTGLVKLERLVAQLRQQRPAWPAWIHPADEERDARLIKQDFLVPLMSQNVVQLAGKDTYQLGPVDRQSSAPIRLFSDEEKRRIAGKPFTLAPFICLRCYHDSQAIDLDAQAFSLDHLLRMLDHSLADPERKKSCECAKDLMGKKSCGGKGSIGTCPESKKSIAQASRIENFRLLKNWLNLKQLYSGAEWFRCRAKDPDPIDGVDIAPSAETTKKKLYFYVCRKCLKKSRANGQTNGFCRKEIAAMIHNLLKRDEEVAGQVHCLCQKCSGSADSDVSTCRQQSRGSLSSQESPNSAASIRIVENSRLLSNFLARQTEKKRLRRRKKTSSSKAKLSDESDGPAWHQEEGASAVTTVAVNNGHTAGEGEVEKATLPNDQR